MLDTRSSILDSRCWSNRGWFDPDKSTGRRHFLSGILDAIFKMSSRRDLCSCRKSFYYWMWDNGCRIPDWSDIQYLESGIGYPESLISRIPYLASRRESARRHRFRSFYGFFVDFYGEKGIPSLEKGFECLLQCAEGATQFSLGQRPRTLWQKQNLSWRDNTNGTLCCPYRTNSEGVDQHMGRCPMLNCVVPLAHGSP